jgi:hypothetical protein
MDIDIEAEFQNKNDLSFNILVTMSEKEEFVAHCLELDIVAVANDLEKVKNEISDLIYNQIKYCFKWDNMEHLYHSAPSKVWDEWFTAEEERKLRYVVTLQHDYGDCR